MRLRFLTSGESHGPALTVILDGLPAGLMLTKQVISKELARRQKGFGAGPRMKIESDQARVLSGVMDGITIGSPVAILIENLDHKKWYNQSIPAFTIPRPGHADLTGAIKYGYRDLRPALERASARETAARVAVGAICKHLLVQFGIKVCGYTTSIGQVQAELDAIPYDQRADLAEQNDVRCPDPIAADHMAEHIRQSMAAKDTLGGILEIIALNLPPGLGSFAQWDRRLEARLGAAVLSVQAIKGVEIGSAFENTRLPGTQAQDAIGLKERALIRPSNRSGGLEGGITNGNPLVIRAAMKPIATTLNPQSSVDLNTGEPVITQYERSDFCPVPRAVPILEAMVAFVLVDALLEKLGGDSMDEIFPRFEALRKMELDDLKIDSSSHIYWPAEE